jgi:hypothetical protein
MANGCAVCRNAIPIGHLFTAQTWFCAYWQKEFRTTFCPKWEERDDARVYLLNELDIKQNG